MKNIALTVPIGDERLLEFVHWAVNIDYQDGSIRLFNDTASYISEPDTDYDFHDDLGFIEINQDNIIAWISETCKVDALYILFYGNELGDNNSDDYWDLFHNNDINYNNEDCYIEWYKKNRKMVPFIDVLKLVPEGELWAEVKIKDLKKCSTCGHYSYYDEKDEDDYGIICKCERDVKDILE